LNKRDELDELKESFEDIENEEIIIGYIKMRNLKVQKMKA